MTNLPFNAKGSFDLGRLSNISLLSNVSIADQILVLKKDEIGKFYLNPQNQLLPEIQYRDEIILDANKSYFHKSTFFNTTNTDDYSTIKTYTIEIPKNASNRRKMYLSLNIDMFGQSFYDSTDSSYSSSGTSVNVNGFTDNFDYYNFTTGYNVVASKSLLTSQLSVLTAKTSQTTIRNCDETEDEFTFNEETGTWVRNCCRLAEPDKILYRLTESKTCELCLKQSNGKYPSDCVYKSLEECSECVIDPTACGSGGSGGGSGSGSGSGSATGSSVNVEEFCSGVIKDPSGTEHINNLCDLCPDAPVTTYTCGSNFVCVPDPTGSFASLSECNDACIPPPPKFRCTSDFECIQDESGTFNSFVECFESCTPPPPLLYECVLTTTPSGVIATCESSPTGTLTLAQCLSTCEAPPVMGYTCSNSTCILVEGGEYETLALCQASCKTDPPPPQVKYSCTGSPKYQCIKDINGTFTSIEDCNLSCFPPPPLKWSCIDDPSASCPDNKRCIQSTSGVYETEQECVINCNGETQTLYPFSEIGTRNTHPSWSKNLNIDTGNLSYKFMHIPGSFTVLVDNTDIPVMFGSENRHQYYDDVLTRKQDTVSLPDQKNQYSNNVLVLQPNYSTLKNPLKQNKFNIKHYPRVTTSINSNGDLVLTIEAKSLQYPNESIQWFGKVELFVSIT